MCQMVKMAVRMWSGRVPLDRRDSGFAHKMTGRQKKECVRVCVCLWLCNCEEKEKSENYYLYMKGKGAGIHE